MSRIQEPVKGIGIVDKQNGGTGQYAHVEVTIEAMDNRDAPNTIASAVIGATIPTAFIPSVTQGVTEGLKYGPIGGYPVVGVSVKIVGGKSHPVDSNAQAFKEAGRLAVQDALGKSSQALLEPVATLEVVTPEGFVGAVVGDINRRRGQITDMTTQNGGASKITARVPIAETFGYATDLRSLTQGRASFVSEPSGYADVPQSVVKAVAK